MHRTIVLEQRPTRYALLFFHPNGEGLLALYLSLLEKVKLFLTFLVRVLEDYKELNGSR